MYLCFVLSFCSAVLGMFVGSSSSGLLLRGLQVDSLRTTYHVFTQPHLRQDKRSPTGELSPKLPCRLPSVSLTKTGSHGNFHWQGTLRNENLTTESEIDWCRPVVLKVWLPGPPASASSGNLLELKIHSEVRAQ